MCKPSRSEGIPIKWLRHYSEGLFALSPGLEGEIESALADGDIELAEKVLTSCIKVYLSEIPFISAFKIRI